MSRSDGTRRMVEGEFDQESQLRYDLAQVRAERDALHDDAMLMRRFKRAIKGIKTVPFMPGIIGTATRQEIQGIMQQISDEANRGE